MISVVIPVYNEALTIRPLYDRLQAALSSETFELIFVDDGSTDDSRSLLLAMHAHDDRVVVLCLSRNFGHQLAITAGVDHARGDAVVVMDGDLQDPPEVIPQMLHKWREGYDVVFGVRDVRHGETWFKRGSAWAFYRILRAVTHVDVPLDAGDFRLLSRRAADAMIRLREQNRFVRGMAKWVGFRQCGVAYERDPRHAGDSRYPVTQMLRLATDAVFSFSTLPLRLATLAGVVVAGLCLGYAVWAVYLKLTADQPVVGWASTIVAILLVGSVQLVCLGIIGEYIGRIYDEVRSRPLYLVGELRQAEPQPAGQSQPRQPAV
ncbi:MAG: glycosyltransferase involved in cell wall biosynthesis [Kiritimatiellia bacterium]|jgi:glycosyltransferase involved in cell wall biosynthesis